MVLPADICIKQEKDDYEYESSYTEANYDLNVKVEIENSVIKSEPHDWGEEDSSPFNENTIDYGVIDYETLIEYCEQKCPVCHKIFGDSYSLLHHNLIHLELKLQPLSQFDTSKSNDSLQYLKELKSLTIIKNQSNQHIFNTSKISTLKKCRYCNKMLPYKSWHEHEKNVHSPRNFQCDICNNKYKSMRYLKRHLLNVHFGGTRNGVPKQKDILSATVSVKLEKDDKNDFTLEESPLLLKPIAIGIRCKLCPSILAHKHALKTHLRNCHCEKVKCNKCDSVLKKSYLNNHMRRVHYDDGKKYSCDCGKSFRSPRYLKIHIKNSH